MSSRAFALTDSPFAVLGVSPRAGREQIEAAVARHPSRPRAVANLLLDLRTRLSHELAWLQGLSGGAADQTLQLAVGGYREEVLDRLNNLRGLNKANLAAHAAARFSDPRFVEVLARAWEGIDTAAATARVNEERAVAGLEPAAESQVVWALQEVRERHAATAARVLTRGGEDPQPLSDLIQRGGATESDSGRRFIDAAVAAYEAQQAAALGELEQQLIDEADRLTRSGSTDLLRFETTLSRWRAAMAPVRELAQARGRQEPRSLLLVGDLRTVYLDPRPGPQRLAPAQEIARRLLAEFPHSTAVQRMVSGDLQRLGSAPVAGPQEPAPPVRTGTAQDRTDARRAERERAQAARPQRRRSEADSPPPPPPPARPATAVPTGAAAPGGELIERLRARAAEAEARTRTAAERVRERVEAASVLPPRKSKKGIGGLLFVGFVILMSWLGRALDNDEASPPAAAAPTPAAAQADADWAAATAAMLASPDRPPEIMPQPGEADLTLEEATYCLMSQRRIEALQAAAEPELQDRVAALDRDYAVRCGGRAASGEALPAWTLVEREGGRVEEDVRRILEVWRAG